MKKSPRKKRPKSSSTDSLDKNVWYIFQLSKTGEDAKNPYDIVYDIKKRNPNLQVFLTSEVFIIDKQVHAVHYLPGYIFIQAIADLHEYVDIEKSPFIQCGLRDGKSPSHTTKDYLDSIKESFLKEEMNKILVGDIVDIIVGQWDGFFGEVVKVDRTGGLLTVKIKMQTIETMIVLPPYALRVR